MLKSVTRAALIGTLAFLVAPNAHAQFTFTFDENGYGLYNNGSVHVITGTMLADPTNPGFNVLTYNLSAFQTGIGCGTVLVLNEDGTTVSDAIRFTNAAGVMSGSYGDRMLYYSADGGTDLADTGLPANLRLGNPGSVIESNGSFVFHAFGPNDYYGTSGDGVPPPTHTPEPGTLALIVGSMVAGGTIAKRRRRA